MAADGGNQWLAQRHASRPHGRGAASLGVELIAPGRIGDRAQVSASTEGAVLAPQHGHALAFVGFEVPVPLFVSQGDKIEIDTRTGEYRKRV